MPKFGKNFFGTFRFGKGSVTKANDRTTIQGIPLGRWVRRSIGKYVTFRVRVGNGYYSSVAGERYQDRYKYFVPSSINNAEGQAARDLLRTSVLNWQTVLTDEEKEEYNNRALKGLRMSGYNLYIREYIKSNY